MKRVWALVLWLAVLAGVCPAGAATPTLSAKSAILMDAESGRILYAYQAEEERPIASTTKLMTALVVLERGGLGDMVTVTRHHMAEGSSMYLKPGDRVTVEELLYGLLLCSGNDAALALADHCGGLERFVAEMNRKAAELGMTGTSFANPNGLDQEGHYSTARDMARLAACAVKNETLVRLCSTRSVTVGGRTMTNHNRLLRSIDGCIGLKTGYTRAAGRTLVSCVRRNGRTLVAVTLQDGNDWADHATLYEFGFGP